MTHLRILSRRRFMRLAGVSVIGLAASACGTSASPTPAPQPSSTPVPVTPTPAPPTPTMPAPGKISLIGGGDQPIDVWGWQVRVAGKVENLPVQTVQIQVNEKSMPANIENDQFSADVPLQEGENKVTVSAGASSPTSEQQMYMGKLKDLPIANIAIRLENGRILLDASPSQVAAASKSPLVKYNWSARKTNPAAPVIVEPAEAAGKNLSPETPLSGNDTQIVLQPPEQDGEYYLTLEVTDQAGRSDMCTTYFTVAEGKPRLDDWSWQNTAWVENAVVYGVIPRKFASSKSFQGIIDRLDNLKALGVTALWLAPVNVSPAGDYGYAIVDYFNLNPHDGTKDDFHRLVQEAHARDIRILMDFVPNHSSTEHPYFQDALKKGKDSHYWTYYDRDENGEPTHYFDWEHLPNLNYSNPEVEQWILSAFSYWVREFDVDGFRVDACWGVKQRKPDFWPRWRQTLKRIKPDLLLLAEASARDEYYFTEGFDAGYDWTDQLGHWAWERVFKDNDLLIYNLNTALTNHRNGYHEDALIFRFLNNNDTGGRFITQFGPAMTRVATVLLLTLPGIPCVYTGDEVGASYTPYGDPQPLSWKDKDGWFDFHKNLISLRRNTPALHSRKWQIIDTIEPHMQVFAYMRYTESDDAPALVLINFLDKPALAEIQLPEEFASFTRTGSLRDLLSGKEIVTGTKLSVPMEPMSARILTI